MQVNAELLEVLFWIKMPQGWGGVGVGVRNKEVTGWQGRTRGLGFTIAILKCKHITKGSGLQEHSFITKLKYKNDRLNAEKLQVIPLFEWVLEKENGNCFTDILNYVQDRGPFLCVKG